MLLASRGVAARRFAAAMLEVIVARDLQRGNFRNPSMSHSSISRLRAAQCLLLMLAAPMYCAGPADAQSRPNQIHTSPQQDPGVYSGRLKVDYPTPYDPATVEQNGATLER